MHAEGTSKAADPYGATFNYGTFDYNRPHPEVVHGGAGGLRSAAHGAYQFMPSTWKGVWGGQNRPMTRENQDLAALQLMKWRGVDPTKPISQAEVAKLAPEWASLPTLRGSSFHGQPVKNYQELAKVYQQALQGGSGQQKQTGPKPIFAQPAAAHEMPQGPAPQKGPTRIQQALQGGNPAGQAQSPAQLIRSATEALGIRLPGAGGL